MHPGDRVEFDKIEGIPSTTGVIALCSTRGKQVQVRPDGYGENVISMDCDKVWVISTQQGGNNNG